MTAPPAGALEACLALLEEYLEAREDVVDGDYGQPAPNEEMNLLRELREARPALLAALRLREGWQPIESAPKTGVAVLLWQPWKSGRNCTVIGHYANGWVDPGCEYMQPEPTHWMPLPAPPTADDLARVLEQTK